MAMTGLPIHDVLPDLVAALGERSGAVLVAPPGAGKTTAVAPALLGEPWCTGKIILTSPRRVAARAAAERMAEMLGEKVGETVGYLTRLDSKHSARTRILVVTEASERSWSPRIRETKIASVTTRMRVRADCLLSSRVR